MAGNVEHMYKVHSENLSFEFRFDYYKLILARNLQTSSKSYLASSLSALHLVMNFRRLPRNPEAAILYFLTVSIDISNIRFRSPSFLMLKKNLYFWRGPEFLLKTSPSSRTGTPSSRQHLSTIVMHMRHSNLLATLAVGTPLFSGLGF